MDEVINRLVTEVDIDYSKFDRHSGILKNKFKRITSNIANENKKALRDTDKTYQKLERAVLKGGGNAKKRAYNKRIFENYQANKLGEMFPYKVNKAKSMSSLKNSNGYVSLSMAEEKARKYKSAMAYARYVDGGNAKVEIDPVTAAYIRYRDQDSSLSDQLVTNDKFMKRSARNAQINSRKDAMAAFTSNEFAKMQLKNELFSKIKSFSESGLSHFYKASTLAAKGTSLLSKGSIKATLWLTKLVAKASLVSPIKKFAKSISGVAKSFKRILIYRSIRAVLSTISKGFSEGVENISKYEKALSSIKGTSALQTMSSYKTTLQSVTNAFGSLALEMLAYVKPAFEVVMSIMQQVTNTLAQLFAALNGQTVFKKATSAAYDYGKAVESANNQLMGFDELNVLSGNGSTNSGGTSYSDMFEEAEVDSGISSIADTISKKLDVVKSKISNIVKDIKGIWNDLKGFVSGIFEGDYDKVRECTAKLLADISSLFGNIGDAIKTILPAAFDVLEAVVSGFVDWVENIVVNMFEWLDENTGLNLSTWILVIKDTFEIVRELLSGLKNNIRDILGGIIDIIAGVLNGDWARVWNGFLTIVQSVFDSIGRFVVAAVQVIVTGINGLLSVVNSLIGTNWRIAMPTITGVKTTYTTGLSGSQISAKYGMDSGYFASGGVPDTGSLFWAGEAGPELVTRVGGRSTVYNEEQLGSSLAYANENVVNAILSATNSIISGMATYKTEVNIGDREIARAATRGNRITGSSLIQGA